MRKIESQMLEAVNNGKTWSKDNTEVYPIVGGMEVQVADAKVREIFRSYKSGQYENNVQNHRFAAWGLTTAEYGGNFYIVGNKRTCELWSTCGYSSRVNDGQMLCRVPNDATGYAQLCHVLEQYI